MISKKFLAKFIATTSFVILINLPQESKAEVSHQIECKAPSQADCLLAISALNIVAVSETDPLDISVGKYKVAYRRLPEREGVISAVVPKLEEDIVILNASLKRNKKGKLSIYITKSTNDPILHSEFLDAARLSTALETPDLEKSFLTEDMSGIDEE